jgi:hypothetical protein
MKLRTAFLALCVLMSSAVVASADDIKVRDHRGKRKTRVVKPIKVVKPVWDSNGWMSLGEQTVHGKTDNDVIQVGVKEGKFAKLTLVVEDSDIELFDLVIHFGNGETYSPTTRHYFKEGSRTGLIDLPGDARYVKKVVFKYGNLPGGGKARIQLWGVAVKEPPPPPPPPFTWDNKGWTMLGERQVHGKKDKDTIFVGAYEGKFDQLTFVVGDSDVDIQKITVHFSSGKKLQLRFKHSFKEGQRTAVIDLPGNNRRIKKIEMKYKNVAGGGRATVQAWGRDTRPRAEEPRWDSRGWDKLGEIKVDSKYDSDSIKVGRDDGRFTKLTFAVEDNDVEIYDITVVFGNKETLSLKDRLVFREGQRTGAIDLPGEKRFIKRVDFKFGKIARGRNATVVVYGLPAPKDEGDIKVRDHRSEKVFDDKGWTLLGEQEVNGANDTDNIVVKTSAKYSKLTLVVLDSDLVLDLIEVGFRRGKPLKIDVGHTFKEGARTRSIDLPGDKRHITQIVLKYGNLAGGGRAKVQIWGK